MAPCGLPFVLALEVATAWWPATSSAGNTQTDPRDEHRQPLWGAPRIHGELLKLGIAIGQTSVAEYMAKRGVPPSQGWKTFLRNHDDGIAAIDLFVVPTISFRLLYGLLIMGHGRRQVIWLGVTHPTAEWIANQLTEARGWDQLPRYLIRDRDAAYGDVFIRRVRSMGIRDQPTSPRSPQQNGYSERLIGSIRRECLDHVVVFGECHLRHLLLSSRLGEGCAVLRTVERAGQILCRQFSAGCTTNMSAFDFRQAQGCSALLSGSCRLSRVVRSRGLSVTLPCMERGCAWDRHGPSVTRLNHGSSIEPAACSGFDWRSLVSDHSFSR